MGRYLIECIDDSGYLSVPLLEVAELGKSLDAVEAVLHIIQALDPPGVGHATCASACCLQLRAGSGRSTGMPPSPAGSSSAVGTSWSARIRDDVAPFGL